MFRLTVIWLLFSLLAGCANQQIATLDDLSALTSKVMNALGNDTERALTEAQDAYAKAREESLDFYAPLHMQRLESAMKQLHKHDLAGEDDAVIASSAEVQGLLENGLHNKQIAEEALAPLLAQKGVLNDIKSEHVLSRDYNNAMADLSDLIVLIESGKKDKAIKESASLLSELQTLELNTMLAIHWQPAANTLDKAEDEDADHSAPVTYRIAEQKVAQANQTIRDHYQDRALSESSGEDALRATQHALFIARAAKKLQKLNHEQAEQKALGFESYLHEISAAIGSNDLRYMDLRDQALAIIQTIKERERLRLHAEAAQAALTGGTEAASTATDTTIAATAAATVADTSSAD